MNIQNFLLVCGICFAITIQVSNCDSSRHLSKRNHHRSGFTNDKYVRKRRRYEEVSDDTVDQNDDENISSIASDGINEERSISKSSQGEDDVFSEESIEETRRNENQRRKKYKTNRIHRYEDSGSFESFELPLPVRHRGVPKFGYAAENRPLFNLLLGILDTFKMSTQHELRRAQERERRRRSQSIIDGIGNHVKNLTTILLPFNVYQE